VSFLTVKFGIEIPPDCFMKSAEKLSSPTPVNIPNLIVSFDQLLYPKFSVITSLKVGM